MRISDPIRQQFFETIQHRDGHWIWPHKSFRVGTGKSGTALRANQVAWIIQYGKKERIVRTCDTPTCCNPKHHTSASKARKETGNTLSAENEVKFHKGTDQYYVRNQLTGGAMKYLGKSETKAIEQWIAMRPFLAAGQTPPAAVVSGNLTMGTLASLYINGILKKLKQGRITLKHARQQQDVAARMTATIGTSTLVATLTPAHFTCFYETIAVNKRTGKLRSLNGIRSEIGKWRTVFKWAERNQHIAKLPNYGDNFPPSAEDDMKVDNRNRRLGAERPTPAPKDFDRDEVHAMLAAANEVQKAWLLVALNMGLANTELSILQVSDFETDQTDYWFNEPRIKTGHPRKAHVWEETIKALEASKQYRAEPAKPEWAQRWFLSTRGHELITPLNSHQFSESFRELMKKAGCYISGRGYAALRHTFKTRASACGDDIAVEVVMGHKHPGGKMNANYLQDFPDDRLRNVSQAMHDWVWPKGVEEERAPRRRLSF